MANRSPGFAGMATEIGWGLRTAGICTNVAGSFQRVGRIREMVAPAGHLPGVLTKRFFFGRKGQHQPLR
jgi:hypothetical protein